MGNVGMNDLLWITPATILAGRLAWDLYGLARDIAIDNYIEYRKQQTDEHQST